MMWRAHQSAQAVCMCVSLCVRYIVSIFPVLISFSEVFHHFYVSDFLTVPPILQTSVCPCVSLSLSLPLSLPPSVCLSHCPRPPSLPLCVSPQVNIAQFHPIPGNGIVYGTKRGKVKVFYRHKYEPEIEGEPAEGGESGIQTDTHSAQMG